MDPITPLPRDDVREFTEALLRTGVMLSDLIAGLLDGLPEDAFAGEDGVAVLLEMLTGTIAPVADAAGAPVVRELTALLGAVSDRVVADLRAALELAGDDPP